jgi:4-amino-4-deoxy-L-arabinose transferase-like glycosyltransferase
VRRRDEKAGKLALRRVATPADPCFREPVELTRVLGTAAPWGSVGARVRAVTRRLPWHVPLTVLVLAVTGLNVLWRALESRPPHWDMGHHLGNSLVYLHGFSFSDPVPFLTAYLYYPPLVYWVTDAFYAVLRSESMWVAALSNIVWIAVLVFATYGVGRRLWNARVGWLSVAFVLAAPMVVSSSKEYMLDLPLTAMAALALYLLVRADGFANRRYSLLLGAACGAGLLVKWTLPLVLVLPMLHASATALAEARQRHAFGRMLNLAGAGVLTLAIAGPWYIHNLVDVLGFASAYSGEGDSFGNPPVASFASATYYVWNLLDVQLYLVPFLFVLVGVGFCFRKRELARRNLYPLLMVIGTFAAFTLLRHKDPRYTLPMLPALAIVATSWLEYLSARARAWTAAALATYAAVAFLAISFGAPLLPKSAAVDLPSTGGVGPRSVVAFAQHGYFIGAPTDEDWHQEDAIKAMRAVPEPQRTFAYEGPDTIWFNSHGTQYYALRYDAVWVQDVARAHFFVRRGPAGAAPAGFAAVDRWRLPDGGTLVLYER